MRDRPSLTAIKIGRAVVYLAHHPRYAAVLPEGAGAWTERVMGAAGLVRPWMVGLFEAPAWRGLLRWGEGWTVPGQMLAFGVRKAFMDAEVRDALAAGARQVVVIGAGFDVLCERLAERHPDVLFVEIDHPATQAVKARALAGIAPPNVRLVAADLAVEPLGGALARADGWDPRARSVGVAEGLLMYLDEGAVRGLFAAFRAATGPGSRLAFSWIARGADGRFDLGRTPGLVRRAVAVVGEPFRWGAVPEELPALLAEEGWRLLDEPWRTDLRARLLVPAGLGDEVVGGAERFSVAEVGVAAR